MESEALRWASVALTVISGEPFPLFTAGFEGLTFQVGGVGLSATPTPGDAEPRTLNPVNWGFKMFPQVRRFRRFRKK